MVQRAGQQQYQNKLNEQKLDEQKRQYERSFEEQKFQSDRTYNEGVRQYDETVAENLRQFNINDVYNDDSNTRLNTKSDQDTDTFNTGKKTAANDKLWKTYKQAGLLMPDGMSINMDLLTQRVTDGDPVAEQIILGMATQFGDLPPGSVATKIQPLPDGGYGVTVTNADGSQGAMTEDASSDPTSEVMSFKAGELSRLAAAEFGMNVITDLTVFDGVSAVNQIGVAKADSEAQITKDKINELRRQRAALGSLPPGGLKRGATFAVANAETQEEANAVVDQILIDTGQAPSDAQETGKESTQAATPWSMDNVDRTTDAGKFILAIEGKPGAVTKPSPARVEKQRVKLGEYREELVNKIKTSEANRARFKSKKPSPEKDGVLKDKAELAMIDGYLDKDKPVLFTQSTQTDAIATALEGKTGDDVLKAVNNGEVQISKDEQLAIAQALKDNEINEQTDLLRLNAQEQAYARVAILASEPDPTIRAQMSRELSNLFDNTENSPSMSRKDEIDDTASTKTYRLNRAKYLKLVNDSLKADLEGSNEAAASLIETTSKLFFGENGDEQNFNAETANMLLKGPALNGFMTRMKAVAGNPALEDQYMMGLNASISLAMAALAGEQDGGIVESVSDFFVRGEVTDNNNPIDFDLRRVVANDTKNPTKFYYTDADGNKTDEAIDAKELQGISESVYEIVREQAIANTPKPKGE